MLTRLLPLVKTLHNTHNICRDAAKFKNLGGAGSNAARSKGGAATPFDPPKSRGAAAPPSDMPDMYSDCMYSTQKMTLRVFFVLL